MWHLAAAQPAMWHLASQRIYRRWRWRLALSVMFSWQLMASCGYLHHNNGIIRRWRNLVMASAGGVSMAIQWLACIGCGAWPSAG